MVHGILLFLLPRASNVSSVFTPLPPLTSSDWQIFTVDPGEASARLQAVEESRLPHIGPSDDGHRDGLQVLPQRHLIILHDIH